MWSVKTSMWSVSGLREIYRFERALRHAAKQNIFSHWLQKNRLIILHFQYFFINLPMLTTSETLSADAGCGRPPNAECVPLWPFANAEARRGWEELLMRSGLTVGNIYMMKAFT